MTNVDNWDAWNFRVLAGEAGPQAENLLGFTVEASDGDIGTVEDASTEEGTSWILVDTGPWIFGRKVVLPAGTIGKIDLAAERVHVDLTKDEVKDSPPPTNELGRAPDSTYRGMLNVYYGGIYRTRAY